jgi:hypothetical protein
MLLAASARSAGLVEHHLRAVQAVAAVGSDACQILQQLEIADAFADNAVDVAVRDSVAEANNHGAGNGNRRSIASLI